MQHLDSLTRAYVRLKLTELAEQRYEKTTMKILPPNTSDTRATAHAIQRHIDGLIPDAIKVRHRRNAKTVHLEVRDRTCLEVVDVVYALEEHV